MVQFVSKQEAIQALKLSGTTLRRYRVQGVLIEGIHWVRVNSRCIRYNLELIQDWLHNRHDPIAHQRAIHIYQSSLLSNQKKSSQRVSSKRT
jgi:tRNA(His) 5'-end guanylyltransferase